MDKYEFRVSLDEINSLVAERRFDEAAQIADTIDWRKVKSAKTLCTVSDIYKICKDYERARDILDLANQRNPHIQGIIYSLCELTIYLYGQTGSQSDLAKAIGLRQEYEAEYPDDPKRLILEYKFYKVSPVTMQEKISTLERLRDEDHSARWGYELASLYHEAGQDDKAADECRRIRGSFTGKFADKADMLALELRNARADAAAAAGQNKTDRDTEPTSGEEERPERSENRSGSMPADRENEYDNSREPAYRDERRGTDDPDREPAPQRRVADDRRPVSDGYENVTGVRRKPYVENRDVQTAESGSAQSYGTYDENRASERAAESRGSYDADHNSELDDRRGTDDRNGLVRTSQDDAFAQAGEAAGNANIASNAGNADSEEQLSVGQVYDEWERIRRDIRKQNDQKRAQRIMQDTGPLLQDFDETAKHGLIESIEKDAARQRRRARSGASAILGDGAGYDGGYGQSGRGNADRYSDPYSDRRGRASYDERDDRRYNDRRGYSESQDRDDYAQDRYDDRRGRAPQRRRDEVEQDRYNDRGRYDVEPGRDDYAERDRYNDRGYDEQSAERYDDRGGYDAEPAQDNYNNRNGYSVEPAQDDYDNHGRYDTEPGRDDYSDRGGYDTAADHDDYTEERYDNRREYEPLPEPENGYPQDREEITAETVHEEPEYENDHVRGGINDRWSPSPAHITDDPEEIGNEISDRMAEAAQRRGSRFSAAVAAADLAAGTAADIAEDAGEDDIATRRWNSEEIRHAMEEQQRRIAEAQALADEEARKAAEEEERRAAEEQAQREAEARAAAEAEQRARMEAEIRARYEAEEKARIEAEERARKAAEEEAAKAAMYQEIEARIRAEFEEREQARLAALGLSAAQTASVTAQVEPAGSAMTVPVETGAVMSGQDEEQVAEAAGTETAYDIAQAPENLPDDAGEHESTDVAVPEYDAEYDETTESVEEPAEIPAERYPEENDPEESELPVEEPEADDDNAPAEEADAEPDQTTEPVEEPAEEPAEEEAPVRKRFAKVGRKMRRGRPADEETMGAAAAAAPAVSAETDSIPPSAASSIAAAAEKAPSEEELKLFGPFYRMRENRDQVTAALDRISLASYTGNLIITGNAVTARRVAQGLLELTREADSNFTGKIAKATGTALNKLNEDKFHGILSKIENGALIIEHASAMEEPAVQRLYSELEGHEHGLIVVMMDARKPLDAFLQNYGGQLGSFTARVDIRPLNDRALVDYGKDYANSLDYALDELAELALSSRIASMQSPNHRVTLKEVRDIVDEAISYGSKKTPKVLVDMISHKRYDADDRIILHEKDFQHNK